MRGSKLGSRPSKADLSHLHRFATTTPRDDFALYTGGSGSPITAGERADLLKAARAGEVIELELEADTFIQRDEPNRNFVRFKPGIMATFAKSFEGQPVLRDHNSYELLARGGTIRASKLIHNEDGSKTIRMRLRLVKPWAVEAALDGTLDRFSIGWSRGNSTVECSICEADWMKCSHYPGDKVEGQVMQLVFTGATGTEVSAVNVPAVVGTGISSISQLSTLDPAVLTDILDSLPGVPAVHKESEMDPKILEALGLPSNATAADVSAAIAAQKSQLAIATEANAANAAALAKQAIADETRRLAEETATIEDRITRLIATGKIAPKGKGEESLRATAKLSFAAFKGVADEMLANGPQVTPAGAPLPALTADPAPSSLPSGKAFLASNPVAASWLKTAGVTEEQFEKHGAGARERIEFMQANR